MEKKLGFGCMRLPLKNPNNQTTIDYQAFSELIDLFMEKGYNYFDTAYPYHGRTSEKAVRACLVERHPRESFRLATKLFMMAVESEEDVDRLFNEQLGNCGVEYFDYYLLHNLNPKSYEKAVKFNCFGYLSARKAEGKVKNMGFSFHGTPELLETILTEHPEVDFVQLQINYLDWDDPKVQSRRCYEVAHRFGKNIIIMEPCKGGELSVIPQQSAQELEKFRPGASAASWAFRFAGNLDGVMMVLSGMNTREQVLDNASVFDTLSPLSEEELKTLFVTADRINKDIAVRCTACRYCEAGCPMNIPIPDCFSRYNRYVRTKLETVRNGYGMTVRDRGKASDCISCRACVAKCPQGLDIPELLKDVAAAMED